MPLWLEASSVAGTIQAPPSKSAMQRAVACAALASGDSTLLNPSFCDDALAAMGVAEALGARIDRQSDKVRIRGMDMLTMRSGQHNLNSQSNQLGYGGQSNQGDQPGHGAAVPSTLVVNCGEAGLCLRMFSAIVALLPHVVELQARGSLQVRPVDMVTDALAAFGVACSSVGGLPPVQVRGPLHGGKARVDGTKSSQFLTGLLIALACADGDSVIDVANLASRGYVDLTLDIIKHFGGDAHRDDRSRLFTVRGGTGYRGRDYFVEGDWSGAAFLLVAGAVAGAGPDDGARTNAGLVVEGLSASSSQPDRAILDALKLAGAAVTITDRSIAIRPASLHGFSFDATDCPDLFPPLAVLAMRSHGQSRIRGVARLRNKESDRAEALVTELGKFGTRLWLEDDELVITGLAHTDQPPGAVSVSTTAPSPFDTPGERIISSRGDHRIAMAAAVAALNMPGRTVIEGSGCVAKSYPEFFDDLAGLGARLRHS
jgi:3-phosphoshikimate 1-carboxyvinyltransferase